MSKTRLNWNIQLDPSCSIVEAAHLMAQLGCRLEFHAGVPHLVPDVKDDKPMPQAPTGVELVRILTGGKHHPASKGHPEQLAVAFEKFGLCLRVKSIHGTPV